MGIRVIEVKSQTEKMVFYVYLMILKLIELSLDKQITETIYKPTIHLRRLRDRLMRPLIDSDNLDIKTNKQIKDYIY